MSGYGRRRTAVETMAACNTLRRLTACREYSFFGTFMSPHILEGFIAAELELHSPEVVRGKSRSLGKQALRRRSDNLNEQGK